LNIGVDMDGVLTDMQEFNRRHAPKYFKKKFDKDVIDIESYDIREMFECTEKEFLTYWKSHLFRYAITEPAREDAKRIVAKLRAEGHGIFIISKRVFANRKSFMGRFMRTVVKNWLWRNGIQYDEIVYCDNDIHDSKQAVCMEKNIEVMIDDEAVNINAIAPVARVICFGTSYNRDCEGENITRAHGWDEIYSLINNMEMRLEPSAL